MGRAKKKRNELPWIGDVHVIFPDFPTVLVDVPSRQSVGKEPADWVGFLSPESNTLLDFDESGQSFQDYNARHPMLFFVPSRLKIPEENAYQDFTALYPLHYRLATMTSL